MKSPGLHTVAMVPIPHSPGIGREKTITEGKPNVGEGPSYLFIISCQLARVVRVDRTIPTEMLFEVVRHCKYHESSVSMIT